jgi:small subunit ribosomal protein S1
MLEKMPLAEGYEETKNEVREDPWQLIYRAVQNRLILQETAVGIEEHDLNGEKVPCVIVDLDGVKCLMPHGESGEEKPAALRRLVGRKIVFRVIGLDRESNLAVISRKAALEQMAAQTWKEIKEGELRTAVVQNVNPYRAELDVGGIKVELPAKEISWGWVNDARNIIKTGDRLKVKVTEVDVENKKIKVSLKEALPDPWPKVPEKYSVGGEYLGNITGVMEYGVFVNLEQGVDALVKLPKYGDPEPGKKALVRIDEINPEKRWIKGKLIRLIY